jgi:hypothetical protein
MPGCRYGTLDSIWTLDLEQIPFNQRARAVDIYVGISVEEVTSSDAVRRVRWALWECCGMRS